MKFAIYKNYHVVVTNDEGATWDAFVEARSATDARRIADALNHALSCPAYEVEHARSKP